MASHPVVACYAGPDSAHAVQLGAALAALLHERLVLAAAFEYTPLALSARATPSPYNAIRADAAQARVHEARRLVREDVEVEERVVPADKPADALADLARETDACLLVVGRDQDGHVTRSLLGRSPCPIAVSPFDVPLPGEPEPIRTIGVAYDGSAASRRAVTAAQHLALRAGARLRLITVGPDSAAVDVDAVRVEVSEALEVEVEVARPIGLPERRLVSASTDLDLLVCGSHGHGVVVGKLLGSVSAHLVKAARCPVVIVPAAARHQAAMPLGVSTAGG